MKWFLNMKIAAKLILSFLLVALFVVAVGYVGFSSILELADVRMPAVVSLQGIEIGQNAVLTGERGLINRRMTEKDIRLAQYTYIDNAFLAVESDWAEYSALPKTAQEAQIWGAFVPLWNEWISRHKVVYSLSKERDQMTASGLSAESTEVTELDATIFDASLYAREAWLAANSQVKQLVDINVELANAGRDRAVLLIVAFALGAGLLSFMLGILISRAISKPIGATAHCAKALAEGKLDEPLSVNSRDETGRLAATIDNEVRQAFKSIEQARAVASKQADYQSGEVQKLLINLGRLARGELICDMETAPADQDTEQLHAIYAEIAGNLHSAVSAITGYIGEISGVLAAMSGGDLNQEITSEYKGDFIALKESINGIANSLSSVLLEINTAADQVASGTRQVSDGSQTISQGATEQASAIEELTASITEIAAQTKQNAANANRANELSIAAKEDAVKGNDQMKGMQQAMAEINESSENISKIIKVIDDIAFQTNILALNAAVEAARAGQHGRGFAVVAEEVRNLAARSANAAKETTELIEGSIKKAEAGTKIADNTAAALGNIVNGVEKAVQLVGEIAVASNEQATGIAQVNRGIEQLSDVVQNNSATSEETAAASEELSGQADMLKAMVAQFILKNSGASKDPAAEKSEDDAAAELSKAKGEIVLNDSEFGKY